MANAPLTRAPWTTVDPYTEPFHQEPYGRRYDDGEGGNAGDYDDGEGVGGGGGGGKDFSIDPPSVSWWYRVRGETACSYRFFSLDELGGLDLDVARAFAPRPLLWTVPARALLTGYIVGSALVYDVLSDDRRWIWAGYLANWAASITALYFVLVTFCTVLRGTLRQPVRGEAVTLPTVPVRIVWALYSLGITFNLANVLLFWTVTYRRGDPLDFFPVLNKNGVTCALMLLDGNVLATIPLRLKHVVLPVLVGILYGGWTYLHSYLELGTGTVPREDNGILYPDVDWDTDWLQSLVYVLGLTFALVPLLHVLAWHLSVWSRWFRLDGARRPLREEADPGNGVGMDLRPRHISEDFD